MEEYSPIESDLDVPTSPRQHFLSLDSGKDVDLIKTADENAIEKLLQALHDVDYTIKQKLEVVENLDITVQIVSFKIFEATHEFKKKIGLVKDERNRLLSSIENRSELSLILNDLDRKITELEKQLDEKIRTFNTEKIGLQEQAEAIIFQLDEDISLMQQKFEELKSELSFGKSNLYRVQIEAMNQKYTPSVEKYEENLHYYERLQLTGWRVEQSEVKLSELLEEQGLKFTPSGRLLTRTGSLLTFQEAQDKGYFKEVKVSLDKVFQFFKDRDKLRLPDRLPTPDADFSEICSTVESKMSSQDVKYLKQYVGKPLTLALAEITAKMPRDPIHYLGHYLFKYRYNQELEEVQKREIEELTQERKRLAQEKWKKFVEEEARNAVIEMILRAEQLAYENELKRIEEEQMLAQEEEEGGEEENAQMAELLEEARDKFE
ncbi:golgin subfamily A member 6-like protein 25 [Tribolium castaneum]|uniref:Uncharacterized protein n=1 Tax=Tribolium castaneum TaxID=7070 RepID=D6WTA2_TRICA|nr:PREDICTED: uncharacterized protein LOC660306 [Tribolium castaneum]EFA06686.2 hypothetical protein TcasGA2_TC009616 [Tribolium castaneum]|eukprot:XP_008195418.2 PREDICTED: uncharacterized protein LOC660306 [Tribolium castaneum]